MSEIFRLAEKKRLLVRGLKALETAMERIVESGERGGPELGRRIPGGYEVRVSIGEAKEVGMVGDWNGARRVISGFDFEVSALWCRIRERDGLGPEVVIERVTSWGPEEVVTQKITIHPSQVELAERIYSSGGGIEGRSAATKDMDQFLEIVEETSQTLELIESWLAGKGY